MLSEEKKIIVVGAGSWGTAIALLLNNNGYNVCLWSYDSKIIEKIKKTKYNNDYLNDVKIDENILLSSDPNIFENYKIIVNVVPTKYIFDNYNNLNIDLSQKIIINCSKGIDFNTKKRISDIFVDNLNVEINNYCVLTGPSHAEEVINNALTSVLSASLNQDLATQIQKIFSNNYFRVYTSNDLVGAEIGGALKNIIAIASGILDGLRLGDNAKAALITRGIAEISRFGIAFGANPITFSGLSGLGDLIVTSISQHSRNRRLGELVGRGFITENIISDTKMISEGYYTVKAIYEISKEIKIEMPISEQIYYVLYENKDPKVAMKDLMSRANKSEIY
jgi:glycerol-3-phosphate dehydrogenase (NAD(P)+)